MLALIVALLFNIFLAYRFGYVPTGGGIDNIINPSGYYAGAVFGYYTSDGTWVVGTNGGFYTSAGGEWCEGTIYGGYYTPEGQWITGAGNPVYYSGGYTKSTGEYVTALPETTGYYTSSG